MTRQEIEFRRTGERRYAVRVLREGRPSLEMDPAPGYDPRMPHDLLHLVVEAQLGLRHGIFGQLAAGGTAGTFRFLSDEPLSDRVISRSRRNLAKRGARLFSEGRRDSLLSEWAADICFRAWTARTDRGRSEPSPSAGLTREQIDRICDHLDALSEVWSSLEIGESLAVEWPTASHRRVTDRTGRV